MGRAIVYVPQAVHERGLALLEEHFEVLPGFGPGARSWGEVLPRVSGILVRTGRITAEHLRRAPSLRVIARHGVGVDNIDVEAATRHGVVVANAPESNTHAVAEHTFALLLAVCRKVSEADRRARTGSFQGRDALVGSGLHGKRLGIIGVGRIGSRVARIAACGFGMRVLGFDPYLSEEALRARHTEPVRELGELLRNCDAVSLHVPLTGETAGLLGPGELALLPRHAVLVHTARGGVVDEAALSARLREDLLAGAGVDVFAAEPPGPDSELLSAPRVVLSPHIASHTHEAVEAMATQAAEAVIAVLHGERPGSVVNPDVLSARSLR